MRRLLTVVTALALAIGGLSPTPARAATACPNLFPSSFISDLEHAFPGVRVTAAVYDTRSGCWSHLHQGMQITTASVIKAQVLGAVLLQAQDAHRTLSSWERSQILPMIRYSDNDATSALYEHVGGTAGMHATDARFGATQTSHVRPFGLTSSTAVDRTNVALRLLHGGGSLAQAGREEAWSYMTQVHPLQQWGITAGVPNGWQVALKNGFYPATGKGWRVGSSGFVRQGDGDQGYAITVMTEGASRQSTGIAVAERVSRQAARILTVGPAAARALDRARCTTTSSGEAWTTVAGRVGLPASRAGEVRLTSGNNPSPLSGQRACSPDIPAEPKAAASTINGSYRVATTDLTCDGRDDLLLFSPDGTDYLWRGQANRRFAQSTVSLAGDLVPIGGDFDGDGCGDLLLYGAGTRPDQVWFGGASITKVAVTVNSTGYVPRTGDLDGDGRTDVLWYLPGSGADFEWFGRADRRFDSTAITVTGPYDPAVGDVDGNGADDIVWCGRGSLADAVWLGRVGARTPSNAGLSVNGSYRPIVLDHDGAGREAIVWYAPGAGSDSLWDGVPPASNRPLAINGDYLPAAGDFDGDGRDDIAWYGPGGLADSAWWGSATGAFSSTPLALG